MRSHTLRKTFMAILLTLATANLKINFMGDQEAEQQEENGKVFLDENEYLEIDLVDYNGLQYTAKAGLGSNNAEQFFLFDTGSSNLWVTSVYCDNANSTQCNNNYCSLYDP